jgi:tetratricopeptide repeat protein 21B
MAQLHLANENDKMAMQSLEMGLSYNFEVRNSPLYHLLKARSLVKQGDFEEAVTALTAALALPGVRTASKSGSLLAFLSSSIFDKKRANPS